MARIPQLLTLKILFVYGSFKLVSFIEQICVLLFAMSNAGFAGIIVCTASLLSLPLRKLRQPKVIAEVLGGIILGKNHPCD